MKKLTQEDFIEKSIQKHGTKYDYRLSIYLGNKIPVEIVCNKHKTHFWQQPGNHMFGQNCPICAKEQSVAAMALTKLSNTEEWIKKAKVIHGDKYDYSKVVYKRANIKVTINCKSCKSDFDQTANSHLTRATGCPSCAKNGYQPDKQGSLYIFSHNNVTKVGITNRDAEVRLKDIRASSNKPFILDYFIKFKDGRVPQAVEKIILSELRKEYTTPEETHDGYTECFLDVPREWLLQRVAQLSAEHLQNKLN